MNKLEEAEKAFLKVRDYFLETQEDFALAKAYSKPWKWYREHTTHNRRSNRDFKSGSKRISKRRRLPGFDSPACLYPERNFIF